jgi:hypothetical protein
MTGKRDRNKNTFYGLVRGMKDPQKWANKFFASILHVISSNAKGGIIAEEDAFANPRQMEANWADPAAIVWARPGGIGKIEQRPAPAYPTGMDRLMEFAISSVRDTTGVNVELLGMADRDQPGIVEAQRKASAVTILAPFFDALKRYRRDSGRVMLTFIRRYLPAQTIARVLGPRMQQYIPALKDETAYRFDVVVEEGPFSTNQKEQTWGVLSQLLPEAMKMGIMPPPSILDYLPLPQTLVAEWKQKLATPDPMAMQSKQLEMAQMAADIAKTQGLADASKARAQKIQVETQHAANAPPDHIIELGKQQAQLQMDLQRLQMDMQAKQAEIAQAERQHRLDMAMSVQEHAQDMQISREQAANQADIARFNAVETAKAKRAAAASKTVN